MVSHHRRLAFVGLLLAGLFAVGACSPAPASPTSTLPTIPAGSTKQTKAIASGTFVVAPGTARDIGFYVDFGIYRPRVTGSFHASGGANDIEVFIANDEDYNSWNIGRRVTPLYNSGVTTAADIDVLLRATGHFHLVLNNKYSNAQKFVEVNIYVEWWEAPPSS